MLIDDTIELLKNGEWHYLDNIVDKLNQPFQRVLEILDFCTEFNIVIFNESENKVKIDEEFQKYLTNI